MAKSKVSQKDTPGQEPIKTFPAGVISYSLFDDLHNHHKLFLGRLDLLSECAYETGKFESVMDLICQIIEQERETYQPLRDRAQRESKEAGGNDVMTIKQEATGGEV